MADLKVSTKASQWADLMAVQWVEPRVEPRADYWAAQRVVYLVAQWVVLLDVQLVDQRVD